MSTSARRNDTKGYAPGKTKTSQRLNTTLSTKIVIASALVIFFLLISALIALIILYSQAFSTFSLSEKQMGEVQYRYNKSLEYIGCRNRTSGRHCGQYFQSICPAGWVEVLNTSRCYHFSQQRKSWENSRIACQILQADLVIIDDRIEQAFIRSTKPAGFYWIGLTDQVEEDRWKWVNGASLQSEAFWLCSQPDNYDGKEHCATVGIQEQCGAMKNWNDDQCEKTYNYICEKEAEDKKIDFISPATKSEK